MTPIKDLTPSLKRALCGLIAGIFLTVIGMSSVFTGKVGYRSRVNGERVSRTVTRESEPFKFWFPTILITGCGVYLLGQANADSRYLWRTRRRKQEGEGKVAE
jgi:hypothetical protein